MNRNSVHHFALSLLVLVMAGASSNAAAQSKEQREKIDRMASQVEELKTEVMLLQRQVQTMLETFNKTNGELSTLIAQMGDNISAIRRAQSSVSNSGTETASQISSIGERMTATNQRMERLSEQFAQLKKIIEDIPKQPVLKEITPGNAEQLFAAAYGDYSRGNYDLAYSEFKSYVETYPSSELADNAQYWIGEILFAAKKFPQASIEFEKVSIINPNGDKAPIALYKRGLALLEMGSRDEAVAQFMAIIRSYPKSSEMTLATQQVQQLAPEQLAPPPVTQPDRTPTRPKPRKP